MKKIFKTLIISALFLSALTSCHDMVFSNILEDVTPEEATVNGSVNAITRYNVGGEEYLVTNSQKGLIYKKASDNRHGAWKTYNHLPFELHHYDYYNTTHYGQQVVKTAADATTLYVVAVTYQNHTSLGTNYPSHISIWAASLSSWDSTASWTDLNADGTKTYIYQDGNYFKTDFNVFCTNTPKNSHRRAYLRNKESELYQLSASSLNAITANKPYEQSGGNGRIDSAIWFNGTVYHLDSLASTTNETTSSDPTYFYYSPDNSRSVYTASGTSQSNLISPAIDAGEAVSCLAITKNALLIGRANTDETSASYGGIVKANATDYLPESKLSGFTTNAAAQMPSSYLINTLLAVDPSQNETETALYGSIIFRTIGTSSAVNYDNVGLWSYYPSRGNWNRE